MKITSVTPATITDEQVLAVLDTVPRDQRIQWLGIADEAMADLVGAPYKQIVAFRGSGPYCRRLCADRWNEIWQFDLDDARILHCTGAIDTATLDDAFIDVTTKAPTHIARRWAACARCHAAWPAHVANRDAARLENRRI